MIGLNAQNRFKALVFVWSVYGLVVGITCTVSGTQVEEIILAALLAVLVLVMTAQLAGYSLRTRRSALPHETLDQSPHETLDDEPTERQQNAIANLSGRG